MSRRLSRLATLPALWIVDRRVDIALMLIPYEASDAVAFGERATVAVLVLLSASS